MLFRQAKWFYNYVVADIPNRLDSAYTEKLKFVPVKKDKEYINRSIALLGSQVKQSIMQKIKDSLKGLHESKENGNKVGKLKFKSKITTIPLKQPNMTFKIDFSKNRIHLQGIKKWFRVLGLKQLSDDRATDIAKAKFISKPDGYYLYVTAYIDKTMKNKNRIYFTKPLGIDFGIESQLTFSNGLQLKFDIK